MIELGNWRDAHKDPPDTNREVFVAIQSDYAIIYHTDMYNDDGWAYHFENIILWLDIPELPDQFR